jgi:hypothetical protein
MAISNENIPLVSAAAIRSLLPCAPQFLMTPGKNYICNQLREETDQVSASRYPKTYLEVQEGKHFAPICFECAVFLQAVLHLPSDFFHR